MMKIALSKPIREEKGQAMILVMILMLVGSLIIVPLLGFMSTGLMAGQANETKMDELYAADAGIEDGLWQIINETAQVPQRTDETWTYSIANVNGKAVVIEIAVGWTIEEFFEDLLGSGDTGPHTDWAVVGESLTAGTYTMTIEYQGAGNQRLDGVGAWFQGTYTLSGLASGITDEYPNYSSSVEPYGGGTAFIWEWTGPDRPMFSPGDTKTLTFDYLPAEIPTRSLGWVDASRNDIGVVPTDVSEKVLIITATATDPTTGKETEVIAYVSSEGEPLTVGILTWEIN